ncbi:MAG TPA: hypothetical protein VJ721_08885 [Chthoniobacterales bacterium]|nr:hypothetical protein [Chthoniobacterales bacterium]
MKWEMISAIGQLVAAIGVIPSLIYLAIQIREQNKERRRAGINILTAQWSELVKSAQENREFALLFLQGVRSFDNLDAPGKLTFSAFFTRYTRNCEGMFIYYRDGALEKALWDEVERTMTDYFAYPGVREWWATRKHWLTDEFRAVVEAVIAKNPEPKMYADYKLGELPKT